MRNKTINSTFNSDNSNIAKIRTQHCQIMRITANRILKSKT